MKKLTKEDVDAIIKKKTKEFEIISIGDSETVTLKHTKCGFVFTTNLYNFLKNCNCPYCTKNIRKKSTEMIKEEISKIDSSYSFLRRIYE